MHWTKWVGLWTLRGEVHMVTAGPLVLRSGVEQLTASPQ